MVTVTFTEKLHINIFDGCQKLETILSVEIKMVNGLKSSATVKLKNRLSSAFYLC